MLTGELAQVCLQKSDFKTIDFKAVREASGLNPPTARMRFSRLKKAIETGTSIFITSFETTSQPIGIEVKSKQQCNFRQANAKGAVATEEEQMQHSGYPKENPTPTDREMGVESNLMIYNQQGIELDCVGRAYEADCGDTEDDDIPLAIKRKAAQCSKNNRKRQKQENASRPMGIKNEPAIADENIGFLSHKVVKSQYPSYYTQTHGLNHMAKYDEVMALGDIPAVKDKGDVSSIHQFSLTNMTLALPAPTTNLQDTVPQYTPPFINSNQFASKLLQQRDLSYDPYRSSWLSTVSQTINLRDPSAAQSLSAHASSCVCSPGISQNNSTTPWRRYRIPNITITDTDPYGVRNPLYPGSTNAVDKVQMTINEALFSPGSKAFGRRYAGAETNGVPRG